MCSWSIAMHQGGQAEQGGLDELQWEGSHRQEGGVKPWAHTGSRGGVGKDGVTVEVRSGWGHTVKRKLEGGGVTQWKGSWKGWGHTVKRKLEGGVVTQWKGSWKGVGSHSGSSHTVEVHIVGGVDQGRVTK